MKASLTTQFLVFIIMIFLAMIILSTAFGNGIVANVIDFFGQSNSKYLAEEFTLLTTTVANAPGDMQAGIKVDSTRSLQIDSNNVYLMTITDSYIKPEGISVDSTKAEGKGIFYVKKTDNQLSVYLDDFK